MLVIGYGNPARGDDGLGPAFAARIASAGLTGVTVEVDYQLTVDHAAMVAEAECAVFVDALTGAARGPFVFEPLEPGGATAMGSHSLSPSAVLTLSQAILGTAPRAFVLGISGEDFGAVSEGLSRRALDNLAAAEAFFLDWWPGERGP